MPGLFGACFCFAVVFIEAPGAFFVLVDSCIFIREYGFDAPGLDPSLVPLQKQLDDILGILKKSTSSSTVAPKDPSLPPISSEEEDLGQDSTPLAYAALLNYLLDNFSDFFAPAAPSLASSFMMSDLPDDSSRLPRLRRLWGKWITGFQRKDIRAKHVLVFRRLVSQVEGTVLVVCYWRSSFLGSGYLLPERLLRTHRFNP